MYEDLQALYGAIFNSSKLGITGDQFKDMGIHIFNSNGDPNNPKAWMGAFEIIEHLNGATVDSSPISHEIIDHSSTGTHIEGDAQNYTFWNDGLEYTPLHPCYQLGLTHAINTNTGHFSTPTTPYVGLKASNKDIIRAGTGDDVVYGLTGDDTLYGEDGNDILVGGTGNDSIIGGADFDFLFGQEGNDTLDGGSSEDLLTGGLGADLLIGGDGFDFAVYAIETSAVSVKLTDQTEVVCQCRIP